MRFFEQRKQLAEALADSPLGGAMTHRHPTQGNAHDEYERYEQRLTFNLR
jgi:hypothetical protein